MKGVAIVEPLCHFVWIAKDVRVSTVPIL